MISMAMELKKRARQVDRKELAQKILDLFGCHLQDYIKAKEVVNEQLSASAAKCSGESERLWKAYSRVTTTHLAMTSDTVQVNYIRAVVDLLLHVLVPPSHLETRTGRFVVGELITCNVLLPLITKLSDPDWLNSLVIEISAKSSQLDEPVTAKQLTSSLPLPSPPTQAEVESVPVPLKDTQVHPVRAVTDMSNDTDTVTPVLSAYDVSDAEEMFCLQNSCEEEEPLRPFSRHNIRGGKSNPFYQENDSDLDSPLADYKQNSTDSLVSFGQEEALCDKHKKCPPSAECSNGDPDQTCPSPVDGSCPKVFVNSQPVEHPNGCDLSLVRKTEEAGGFSSLRDLEKEDSSPSIGPGRELLLGIEQSGPGNPSELTEVSPLQGSCPMPSFSFDPLSSPDGPVVIQNLRISGTITAKEHRGTGSHPYTLYTIKYETAMTCENPQNIPLGSEEAEVGPLNCDHASSMQPVAYHTVNRRYSEFLNLQTRLEEKPDLRKLIKGVKGPKKVFPDMPFGNMDSDRIEARKGLLETFLKQLCAISEIANSEEMQEFLALNTDARIAFVKKPFIVSRIDKIVVNAIVDTLKTAFPRSEPQSPTEENDVEVDGGKLTADKKSKSRLKFSSKNIPTMNGSEIRSPVLFSWESSSKVMNGMSLENLETFITSQEKLSIRDEPEKDDCPVLRKQEDHLSDEFTATSCQGPASEMALTEVILNILCLLMKTHWSWLCTENIQKTIRLLFGTLVNRWVDVSVANLTCTRYWVVYLQVIQEAVWPGGTLPSASQLERSQQQKDSTRQQALQCLMRLLPDLVPDMLGPDKYKLSWKTALDSFQNPNINRHLVYCILDVLLEFLVPEMPEDDFQRSLLQTLSKSPEKTLA
ncbi:uncharacterized protein V6R79_002660 [Siganus canaliculatus]